MIKLTGNYVVQVDVHNYTLLRDRGKPDKDGKPTYETIGYYGDLAGAMSGAIQHMTRLRLSDGEHELADAVRVIRECTGEFKGVLEQAVGGDVDA